MNSQRLATPRLRICLALAFAGASLSVQANECGNIADNSQRLACYDKAFRPQPATPAAAAVGLASGGSRGKMRRVTTSRRLLKASRSMPTASHSDR